MGFLAVISFAILEAGLISSNFNDLPLAKVFIVITIATLTLFVIGFGLSNYARGGLIG
jgi:hypothetical protein